MTENDQIWTRRKNEGAKAFGLFCIYRDLGPFRSLEQALEIATKTNQNPPKTLKDFSSKWDWVSRAEAYDDYLDEAQREKNLAAIEEMNTRQADDAVKIQKKAINDFENPPYSESQAAMETRRKAAASTWEIGVRNERLARGVATERTEQSGRFRHEVNRDDEELLKDPDYIASKRKAMDEYHAKKKDKQ